MLEGEHVLVTGGFSGGLVLSSAEEYDPNLNSFTAVGNMSVGRAAHTLSLLNNGHALVVGGNIAFQVDTPVADEYDPTTHTFFSPGALA